MIRRCAAIDAALLYAWIETVERIGDFLLSIVGRLYGILFSAGSQFSLTSLLCALAIAGGVLAVRHIKRRGRVRPRAVLRTLFPRAIVLHRSTRVDLAYGIFNCFIYGSIFGSAAVSYQFLTNGVVRGLVAVAGPTVPSALPEIVHRSVITLVLFLAYELGYWIDHYLKHHVPALWEVHKVHHSAEVLTPLTAFRMHPLDTLVFGHILAITAAIANGVMAYLFGDTAYQYALSGTNVILAVFIHLYVHLQHTHLWIAFRGVLGRLFISPAHHQIHHSTDPAHFNRNLGSCLAIWDWLFGTLHMPARTSEKLAFGVEPGAIRAHTFAGEFVAPFWRSLVAMLARLRRPSAHADAGRETSIGSAF